MVRRYRHYRRHRSQCGRVIAYLSHTSLLLPARYVFFLTVCALVTSSSKVPIPSIYPKLALPLPRTSPCSPHLKEVHAYMRTCDCTCSGKERRTLSTDYTSVLQTRTRLLRPILFFIYHHTCPSPPTTTSSPFHFLLPSLQSPVLCSPARPSITPSIIPSAPYTHIHCSCPKSQKRARKKKRNAEGRSSRLGFSSCNPHHLHSSPVVEGCRSEPYHYLDLPHASSRPALTLTQALHHAATNKHRYRHLSYS